MDQRIWMRALNFLSDNRKSKIKNRKWLGLSVIALVLLVTGTAVEAQQTGKVYRVGILRSGGPSSYLYGSQHKVLQERLRELGYVEGKNLLIEYRYAENKLDRLPDLARELVGLQIDVLVISPSRVTILAAQQATRKIPIVVLGANLDPVKAGFIKSLSRPGGNLTGLTNLDTALHAKRLGLLKEAFPPISRLAIIWNQAQEKEAGKEVEATAKALDMQILSMHVETRKGLPSLESALIKVSQEQPNGLLVSSLRTTLQHRSRIVDFAAKKRLPTIYARSDFVDAGGLMSYDTVTPEIYRSAATYVAKILRGAKAADLPMERPTKFEFVLNLKTAEQLGLAVSPNVLVRADRVIK